MVLPLLPLRRKREFVVTCLFVCYRFWKVIYFEIVRYGREEGSFRSDAMIRFNTR